MANRPIDRIAQIFYQLQFAETMGSGLKRIESELAQRDLPAAHFESSNHPDRFVTTFRFQSESSHSQSGGEEPISRKDEGKSRKDGDKSRMGDAGSRKQTPSDIARQFDIPEALARRIVKLGGKAETLRVQRLLVECCAVHPFSTSELAELFGRTRDHLTRQYLKPLLDDGGLERTHPENPRHPKQAYKTAGREEE